MAQVKDLVAKKVTLRRFELEARAENTSEDGAEVVEMLSEATRKHYNVVEIREADSGDESSQHDRHETLIRRRGITKPEWHFNHFEEFDVGDECSFLDVGGGDGHLVIGHRQVERREDGGACEGVECLIKPKQKKTIELRRFVDSTIVDAHTPGSIFLLNHYDRRRPWRCRRARDVRVHQLLDFTLNGDALISVGNATSRLAETARVAGVDLMKHDVNSADVGITFSEDVQLFFDEGAQF